MPRDRKMAETLWGEAMPVAMRRIVKEILIVHNVCNLSPLLLDGVQLGSPNLPSPPGYPRGHTGPKCKLMLSYMFSGLFTHVQGVNCCTHVRFLKISHFKPSCSSLFTHLAQGYLPSEINPSLPNSAFGSSSHSSQPSSDATFSKICPSHPRI